jgi:hypothetical protein
MVDRVCVAFLGVADVFVIEVETIDLRNRKFAASAAVQL